MRSILIRSGALVLAVLAAGASAQKLSPEDQAIIDRSRQIVEQALQSHAGPAAPASGTSLPAVSPVSPAELLIFISRSLPDGELRALFAAIAGRADVRLVFRGVRPGERLPAFLRSTHELLAGLQPAPNVGLDPEAFRAHGVSAVPELVLQENHQVIARVRGTLAVDWFLREVAAGRRGDFGAYGPVREIAEPDLLEELQRRAAALDGAALKRWALARFWEGAAFVELPETVAAQVREVDPTVQVMADIAGPDGRLIARAGDRINPLAVLPFTSRLVVFDPLRPAQVAVAQAAGRAVGLRRVIYLVTRLDRQRGWQDLHDLETRLGQPVYLLTADLAERLQLQRAPAVVEAAGPRLRVEEIVP